MCKQDRQGARTVADLERRHSFGKKFSEIMGISTEANEKAEEVAEKFKGLTHKEIFNLLTDNGRLQGLYKGENGDYYFNAKYLSALEELFAKNITMTGTFSHKVNVFLEPEQAEIEDIKWVILNNAYYPYYDFNNDGVVNSLDLAEAKKAMLGITSLSGWSGAKLSEATLTIDLKDPNRAICMKGKNMWGREVERYIGLGFSSLKLPEQAQARIIAGTKVIEYSNNDWAPLFTIEEIISMYQERYASPTIDQYALGISLVNGDARASGSIVGGRWLDNTLHAVLSGKHTGSFRINYCFTAYF